MNCSTVHNTLKTVNPSFLVVVKPSTVPFQRVLLPLEIQDSRLRKGIVSSPQATDMLLY